MSENIEAKPAVPAEQPAPPAPPPSKGVLGVLSSMRFALGLLGAIVVACIVATLVPQGAEVTEHLQHNPNAAPWLKRLAAAGLTNIFSSWWFIAMLTLLAASLLACMVRRSKILFNSAGLPKAERMNLVGTLLAHAGLLLTLVGGAIRIFFADHGMIQFREGEQVDCFLTEENQRLPLPFVLQLVKFEVERYPAAHGDKQNDIEVQSEALLIQWPGATEAAELPVTIGAPQQFAPVSNQTYQVTVLRRVTDFVVDTATREVRSRSEAMVNPAILVRVAAATNVVAERWLFARFPDFDMNAMAGQEAKPLPFKMNYQVMVRAPEQTPIKAFRSTLRVLKAGVVAREQAIEVNAPLSVEGYTFFQSGYNEQDLAWTSLRVVRDPSVPTVYTGFILLCVGAFLTACWRMRAGAVAE
jgi:cytochrome c biogenesis protein ResB